VDGPLDIALPGGGNAEGDAGFGGAHGTRSVPSKSVLARMNTHLGVS
jgi:hypothetical protein